MDLLQEGDLLLQCLNPSLQVQTSQSGSIHVLQTFGKSVVIFERLTSETANRLFSLLFLSSDDMKTAFPKVKNTFNV